MNRERNETTCKSIPLKSFSISNKDQDFPIWIQQFEEAVNRGHNPHSQRRHYNYCLQWLPGSLETDAYAIWGECTHAKSNWTELKRELEEKFEDPAIRKEWRTNPKALMWDEGKESLQSFAAKVRRKVNTYDAELAVTDTAKAINYCTRFMNGMPEDYIQHLNLNMPTKNQRIEKALEVCVRFQAYKRTAASTAASTKAPAKTEVGASVAFQDPTMPSRVTKAETDIIRLSNRLSAVEENHPNSKPPQESSVPRTQFAGRSPRRPFSRNFDSTRSQSPGRDSDRWSRLTSRKQTGFNRRNPNHSGDRRRDNRRDDHKSTITQQASLEEGLALLSEAESGPEDLDDTVADFMRMEQMGEREKLAYFGALRDRAGN